MELIVNECPPTICLNMIVKNESHIIKNTLEMLCKKIDFSYWVICDTGSTDNTREIITEFFKEKNIKGELHNDEWKDFAHNRTLALNAAYGKTDLLLIFDADDEIHGKFEMPNEVDCDGYYLNFGSSGGISYKRVLLINNKIKWRFESVLHEYIVCLKSNPIIKNMEGNYYVVSGRTGSRNKDPNKYIKDAELLKNAYNEAKVKNDGLYLRYGFYCANSYKDAGKFSEAIEWYKTVLSNNNWSQEKYMSCLQLYNCSKAINQEKNGFYYLVEAFKYDPERLECLYYLVHHYCIEQQNKIAYLYYKNVQNYYENKYLTDKNIDKLFLENEKYEFLLPYYMILVADKVKDEFPEANITISRMFQIIFTKKYPINNSFLIDNMLYNLQFFITNCIEFSNNFIELLQSYIDHLQSINYNIYKLDFLKNFQQYGLKISNQALNPIFSNEECANSNKILFYTGFSNLKWNYTYSLTNALGGSETAVTVLSKCFPKDYEIYVAGDVSEEKVDNITYINLQSLRNLVKTTPFHTVIVSRYIGFYEMFPEISFYQSFIWGHDICLFNYGCNMDVKTILSKWNSRINGCICQTKWHKDLFSNQYPEIKDKIFTINNGIQIDKFKYKINKISNTFLYSSCTERGLDRLLELWPQILNEIPDAKLNICSYNKFPHNDYEQKLDLIIKQHSNSIKHLGNLDRNKLYALMASSEYWLYPTNFNETSCITAMEMLMSEVICIYYPVAGLVDTLGDYGISVSKDNEINTILNLTTKNKKEIRQRGKDYALCCSWENRFIEWNKLIKLNKINDEQNINKEPKKQKERVLFLYKNFSIPDDHINFLKKMSETFTPNVIYDIGASTLHWTKEAKKIWEKSEIIVFDAIKTAEFLYKEHNLKYHIGVLSDDDNKTVKFYENLDNPAGNSYYKEIGHENSNKLYPENNFTLQKALTLSTVVKNNNFNFPDLIKIDVQGAELDVIKGSLDIINKAKYLIVELQHVEYNKGAPLYNITIDFLNKNGWELLVEKFSNNGPDADYCFINTRYTKQTNSITNNKISIFNSFSYHYEMFGYILNFAKNNGFIVDIYTNQENDLGWFNFYENNFKGTYSLFNYNEYKSDNSYFLTFVTTDDDKEFKKEWINNNVVCITHWYNTERNPNYINYLNIHNFNGSKLNYCVSCYPIININEKQKNTVVTIIGSVSADYEINYKDINRLTSKNKIILNIVSRNAHIIDLTKFNSNFIINLFNNIDTVHMINILKNTTHLFVNFNLHPHRNNGISSSGSISLALSCLCKLIIFKQLNSYFKFKNTIEITENSEEPIDLDNDIISFDKIEMERNEQIIKFQNYVYELKQIRKIPKKIIQTWEHKNLNKEFQQIVDLWKIKNNEYEYFLFDKNEREEFIKLNFDSSVLKAYNCIIPGAYKADLFRYCYLYINGGVYVDIDTLCIGKLDDFININSEFVTIIDLNTNPYEGNHNLANGFIASIPKHPILYNCIQSIVKNIEENIVPNSKLDFSGPGLLGRCVNKFLGNEETSSFIDKYNDYTNKNIYLLKFEQTTEYIKNSQNKILFQNKNGNQMIQNLYNYECSKNKNYLSWLSCNPIAKTSKNIALMMYGQFRTFKNNLIKNIDELNPILEYNNVYVFILSDKQLDGNYSIENESEIKNMFEKMNIKICFIDYIENYESNDNDEQLVCNNFFSNIQHTKGIANKFVPNLIYRKYLLNKLKNEYIEKNNLHIDLTVYCRLFDTIITKNINNEFIKNEINNLYENTNLVLGSSDTFFMGSKDSIDFLFSLSEKYKLDKPYHDNIWENNDFNKLYYDFDSCLSNLKHTYAPEVQYIAHIFFSNFKYKNIRVDYNNLQSNNNINMLYDIRLDQNRHLNLNKKIIDCFIFYNELDLLNYRLNILNDVVDYFIIVESKHTHTGKEKNLYFQENTEKFKDFLHKIIHIVVEDFPYVGTIDISKNEQWLNENFQRNCIYRGINKLQLNDNDLITVCDLDEIPDPRTLLQLKNDNKCIPLSILELDFYYYNLHCKHNIKWCRGTKILSYKAYKELDTTCEIIRTGNWQNLPVISKGGWHLSYFGDAEFIKNKLMNFTHQEFNSNEYTDIEKINIRINNCLDLFGRYNHDINYINIEDNDYLPPKFNVFLKKFYKNKNNSNDDITIHINNDILDNFILKNEEYLVDKEYYKNKSGLNEYRLYSYISTFFNGVTILDIGTYDGRSAVALSHNETNKVISYNITDQINQPNHKIYTKNNIEFRIKNVLDDLTEEFISNCKIIMIDIDHFETIEKIIIQKLYELNFSGIILLDDIIHPDPYMYICMQRLWNNITYDKIDLTKYGHISGTGCILMNTDIKLTFDSPKKIIGFHSNQISERGTEIALYDYAYYNQKLYGNKSIIFYGKNNPNNDEIVIQKFEKEFKCYAYDKFSDIDQIILDEKIDYFYIIKSGSFDDRLVKNCPNLIHSVFTVEPHGEKYAAISKQLARKYNNIVDYVPHMINLPVCNDNMRNELNIPQQAIVLGRIGGFGQFDIEIAHNAIKNILDTEKNIIFLFVNTKKFYEHPQIIYLDKIIDPIEKVKFINTCDAMIHARSDGETFGLAVAEFSSLNKPVITCISEADNSHIDILEDKAIIFNSEESLINIFKDIRNIIQSQNDWNAYRDYTPEKVMKKFMDVFIKDSNLNSYDKDFLKYTDIINLNKYVFQYFKNDCMAKTLVQKKCWEPHITNFIKLYNKLYKIENIIDIGANFGYHSILFSDEVIGNVYSFEPQIQNFQLLINNIKNNNIQNIITYNYACGDIETSVRMPIITNFVNDINMGDFTPNYNYKEFSETKSILIDNYNFPKIDIIKIDVQGWEKKVLIGSKKLIEKYKPILIIEFEELQLNKINETCESLIKYLREINYHIFYLDYIYPADHICVHNDCLNKFRSFFRDYIHKHNTDNNINNNIKYNINEKICLENYCDNKKYKLSACLMIKNETENLTDWLEHYVNQGVEHFFILSNNSTDNIEQFIESSVYKNMITLLFDNREANIYNDQLNHRQILCDNFYKIVKESSEWAILVDIDEFMTGKNGYTLSSYIDTIQSDIGCVYVYWNIFKPTTDLDGNIAEKFERIKSNKRINLDIIKDLSYEIKFASKFGKSLFRTSMLDNNKKLWIHKVPTNGKIITNYGNVSDYTYDNADDIQFSEENYNKLDLCLNHYAIRNIKDYNSKINQLNNEHRFPFVRGILDIATLDDKYCI